MDRHHIIDALQKQSENFFPILILKLRETNNTVVMFKDYE